MIFCFCFIYQQEWGLKDDPGFHFCFVLLLLLFIIWPGLCILFFFLIRNLMLLFEGPYGLSTLSWTVKAVKRYFSWQMAHVFHFPACLKPVYTQMYFIFWRNRVFQATPLPQPVLPFLRPKIFCVTTTRRLFLEIYVSFSDIRRDLCSSYFYCKSNSLEKKYCNLYESFIFILVT